MFLFIIPIILTFFVLIISIFFVVVYVYSHAKALKIIGYKYYRLAYIPFITPYVMALSTENYNGKTNIFGMYVNSYIYAFSLLILNAISSIIAFIPFFGYFSLAGVLYLFNLVYTYIYYNDIYSKIEGKNKSDLVGISILSALFPIVAIVKFFLYKNKETVLIDCSTSK